MVSQHSELKLVRGILNAPGDTGSAETGYTIIDLLAGSAQGFALNSELGGWDPALPAPKPGLWTDIPFADGRVPFASAEMNVTETLRLTVTAPTHLIMSQLLSELVSMAENCDRFWNDEFFNQPTFLHWWATGAPGRQYALIMSIDVDVSIPTTDDGEIVIRDVVLTIEREPYWRAEVPPGANPIYWTLFSQGKLPGLNYDYLADLRLSGNSNFPVLNALARSTTVSNVVSYSNLAATANVPNNWNGITIPAASIPGDAPALAQITLSQTNISHAIEQRNYTFMVARSTKDPQLDTMRDNSIARFVTMLPFTAGNYGVPSVLAGDTGGISGFNVTTGTTIALSRIEHTPAGGGVYSTVVTYTVGLGRNIQRGRFAIFLRCRQHNGASGDITVRVRFNGSLVFGGVLTRTATAPLQTGAGATTNWNLLYIDTIRLPIDNDGELSTFGSVGGTGLFNTEMYNVTIAVEATRSTGVGVLYYADLVMLPYDEVLVDTVLSTAPATSQGGVVDAAVLDSTGYLTRGKPASAAIAMNLITNPTLEKDGYHAPLEYRGAPLTLLPNQDNTLFILEKMDATGGRLYQQAIEANVNIVPRWRGVRQV